MRRFTQVVVPVADIKDDRRLDPLVHGKDGQICGSPKLPRISAREES
jgi:hypothetical protein